MILARVCFGSGRGLDKKELTELADSYLHSMCRRGQILGSYYYAWHDGSLNGYTHLAAPDALHTRSYSKWGRQYLEKVREAFGREPEWTIIDDEAPRGAPRWRTASFLYLFVNTSSDAQPVRRGDDGKPIPSYRLPLPDEEVEYLLRWSENYQEYDSLWLWNTGLEIEMRAYREMADPESDLSQSGRDFCRMIEECTGKPTYYYLFRFYGRKKGEEKRRCPGCGGKWQRILPASMGSYRGDICFRCDECRLVSNEACSDEDERHARIGEYAKRKKNR